ncbi:MAG: class II glutamine amidotransferase [Pirellulales bacterium]|nr:class II glutamine amidotransferase [Pirellulales bacterium]
MCGLFGYITKTGGGPDLDLLRRIATETEQRGDHAFGLAWIDQAGRLQMFKRPGAVSARLGDLDRCRHAQAVIGHCRWATHGSYSDNDNNHPHSVGRGWLAHNGVVRNYRELARQYGLVRRTACDTESLALLMAKLPGSLLSRATRAVVAVDGPLAILGLWANPLRLVIARRGNPLCCGETDDGAYLGSLAGELPGHSRPFRDDQAGLITFNEGIECQWQAIPRAPLTPLF